MPEQAVENNVIDLETGEPIPASAPVRDETVHHMLVDLMNKNEAGRISAIICVLIDDLGDTSYDAVYPVHMPPAAYIGALEITKQEILRTVRSTAPSYRGNT